LCRAPSSRWLRRASKIRAPHIRLPQIIFAALLSSIFISKIISGEARADVGSAVAQISIAHAVGAADAAGSAAQEKQTAAASNGAGHSASPAGEAIVSQVDMRAPQPAQASVWAQELMRNATIQAKLRNEMGDRVFFGPGSAALGTRALTALAAQAQWLKQWPEFEAAIEGHADEPGSNVDNLTLSAARAESVRRALIGEGVGPERLAVVAWGRTRPIALCSDGSCAGQNRRVVTLVFARGAYARLGLKPDAGDLPPPGATSLAPDQGTTPAAMPERVGVTR
jgi:peptidoglycan-associated lipoprotein